MSKYISLAEMQEKLLAGMREEANTQRFTSMMKQPRHYRYRKPGMVWMNDGYRPPMGEKDD